MVFVPDRRYGVLVAFATMEYEIIVVDDDTLRLVNPDWGYRDYRCLRSPVHISRIADLFGSILSWDSDWDHPLDGCCHCLFPIEYSCRHYYVMPLIVQEDALDDCWAICNEVCSWKCPECDPTTRN